MRSGSSGYDFVAVPELPEVEFTRRQLQRAMAGARFRRVTLRRDTLRFAIPADFVRRLEGQLVRKVTRRAKYLLVQLASDDVAVVHLGMSGSFRVVRARETIVGSSTPGPHDHVVFHLDSGADVVFNDPRRFGVMDLVAPGELERHASVGSIKWAAINERRKLALCTRRSSSSS